MGRNKSLQPIRPDEIWPLELFLPAIGIGQASMHMARRNGLAVHYIHGRAYVIGKDWISYVKENGKATKDGRPTQDH